MTAKAHPVIHGKSWYYTWTYCPCMQTVVAAEERVAQSEEAQRQARIRQAQWAEAQRAYDLVFPQWHQSSRAARQTLETFRVQAGNRRAYDQVRTWLQDRPREGFMLTGPVGTGKTHLLRSVVHAVLAAGDHVLYTSVPYLLERLRDQHRDAPTMDDILRLHVRAPLVVWDDLGAERPTEWTLDRLFLLVDARYEVNHPMLLTTNWTPKELEDRIGARITSRLLEMTSVWAITGADERIEAARRRLERGAT